MKSKRSKACDISQKTKSIVWERDNKCCIICGDSQAMPNAHFIPRSHGGLGVEENIVTLCQKCHNRFDNSTDREVLKLQIKNYLKYKYPQWDEKKIYFTKEGL